VVDIQVADSARRRSVIVQTSPGRKDEARRSMARADIPTTKNRVPGARLTPTVQEAYTGLIERLSGSKPHRILYIADARDLRERAEHLQQVLGAVLDYDPDHVAPGGSIDRKYLLGLISDVAGDVAGSISSAADDLAARRAW
jgi:hypothetical protein